MPENAYFLKKSYIIAQRRGIRSRTPIGFRRLPQASRCYFRLLS